MASPLGHALAGLILHTASAESRADRVDMRRAGVFVALAAGADFDLLARFVDGRNHHHGPTHGVGFALLAALGVWTWGHVRHWTRPRRAGLLAGLAWLSHALVDYVSCDTSLPFGPMLLWPFSQRYWIAPFPIFLETSRAFTWAAVHQNVLAMAWEAALLLPVLLVLWRIKDARWLVARRAIAARARGLPRASTVC